MKRAHGHWQQWSNQVRCWRGMEQGGAGFQGFTAKMRRARAPGLLALGATTHDIAKAIQPRHSNVAAQYFRPSCTRIK